jgi:hypothetical protein
MLSEISQFHKDEYHVLSHIWTLGSGEKHMKIKGELLRIGRGEGNGDEEGG